MSAPPAYAREELDRCIQVLARLSDDVTLDDFRPAAILAARDTARRVRRYVVVGGFSFLTLALGTIVVQAGLTGRPPWAAMISAAAWSFALGGIGVIASIFVHLLKLIPQQSLNTADEFDVLGRVILGCLFSTIMSVTLIPDVVRFFASLESLNPQTAPTSGALVLLPFLLGYSIPLALRILEKVIQAVEIAIGADDRRTNSNRPGRRPPRRG